MGQRSCRGASAESSGVGAGCVRHYFLAVYRFRGGSDRSYDEREEESEKSEYHSWIV
jgi:hypothetical protein